jgi:selenocysteine lyase/cysteine desulfurase
VGTQSFEAIAGARAAVEYIASLGEKFSAEDMREDEKSKRREMIKAGMEVIRAYEKELFARMMRGLKDIEGIQIFGITDTTRFDWRAPTVAFTFAGQSPRAIAEKLAAANINVWDGNYYALEVIKRLGLEEHGGTVRVGLAHYNTAAEVDRFLNVLETM